MQKKLFTGKCGVQIMVLFVIISVAAFAAAAPPLSIPDYSMGSLPDIKPISLKAYHATGGSQGPWTAGETINISGDYYVYGCPHKPFFGKITINGNTLIEQQLQFSSPDCPGQSNSFITFDGYLAKNWQATAGTHAITFTVDSKNDIAEAATGVGNTLSTTITVSALIPSTIPVPLSRGK